MTADQRLRFMQLCTLCSQGDLTPSEHNELQGLLRDDPQARQAWFEYQDQELALRKLVLLPAFAQTNWVLNAFNTVTPNQDQVSIGVQPKLPATSGAAWYAMIAVVVLICVSIAAMLKVYSTKTPLEIASSESPKAVVLRSPTHGLTFAIAEQPNKLIALHFLLKTECPFCLKQTYEYARLAETTPDVLHVFLKPDSSDEIREWSQKIESAGLDGSPVIYRDPDASLAKELGIPDGFVFHGQSMHYPALVLLDSSGRELFRYVGKDNADRMPTREFSEKLAAITSQHSSSIRN